MKGSIVQRSKGSWSIKLELGNDPATGKRKQKWITIRGNKRDAERELARRVNEVNTGGFIDPSKLTVAAYLDQWLTTYAESNVAGKTLERYRSIIEHHLKPDLGAVALQKLTPLQIQAHYSKALKDGGRKDGRKGGLSSQTVFHHHRLLSEALGMAVGWNLLVRNPTDNVHPPSVDTTEVEVIDETAAAWLLESSIGTRLFLPIMLAIGLGLRRGEILALRWSSFNPTLGTMTVSRALEQTKLGGVKFKEVKGKRTRTVAVPTVVAEALEEHRERQRETKAALGSDYKDDDLICCLPEGLLWKPSAFTSSYCALLQRRKLKGPNFHALRHSHASHLIKSGVDIKQVSVRLGHAKAGFTLNTYVHLLPGQDQEAAKRVDVVLRKAIDAGRKTQVM